MGNNQSALTVGGYDHSMSDWSLGIFPGYEWELRVSTFDPFPQVGEQVRVRMGEGDEQLSLDGRVERSEALQSVGPNRIQWTFTVAGKSLPTVR